MRRQSPTLTAAQAFERVFTDQANAECTCPQASRQHDKLCVALRGGWMKPNCNRAAVSAAAAHGPDRLSLSGSAGASSRVLAPARLFAGDCGRRPRGGVVAVL